MILEININKENRNLWLKRCDDLMNKINEIRAMEDKMYEKSWRKRFLLPNRPETAMPPYNYLEGYPSRRSTQKFLFAENLKNTLNDWSVNKITLEGYEYEYFTDIVIV